MKIILKPRIKQCCLFVFGILATGATIYNLLNSSVLRHNKTFRYLACLLGMNSLANVTRSTGWALFCLSTSRVHSSWTRMPPHGNKAFPMDMHSQTRRRQIHIWYYKGWCYLGGAHREFISRTTEDGSKSCCDRYWC